MTTSGVPGCTLVTCDGFLQRNEMDASKKGGLQMTGSPGGDGHFALAETHRTLPIALLRAREAVMDRFRPLLKRHNVTEQQWRVLRVLRELVETDATALAHTACILPPSLTRILKSLDAAGLVSVARDSRDGRRMLVTLTDDGHDFLNRISAESAAIYADVEHRIGPDRLSRILDELEYLQDALSAPEVAERP